MNKNKFSYFDKVPAPASPAGDCFETDYKLVREDNNLALVEVGKIDLQERISSYENDVSLPRMIARFQAGDTSVFSGDSGFYGDVSGLSRDLQSAIHAQREAYRVYSDAVRQKVAEQQKSVDAAKQEGEVKQDGEA